MGDPSERPDIDILGNTGWLRDTFDGKDHEYKGPEGVQAQDAINLRDKYPDYWDPPYRQTPLSSCVANATAAVYRYEAKKVAAGNPPLDYERDPSRTFIYWTARAAGEPYQTKEQLRTSRLTWTDGGTYPRAAMKALHQFGVCKEEYWPYTPTEEGYLNFCTSWASMPKGDVESDKKRDAAWDRWVAKMKEDCNIKPRPEAFDCAHFNRIASYERLDV